MDSAFFSEAIIDLLDTELVAFTCSVPFERLPELKRGEAARGLRTFCDTASRHNQLFTLAGFLAHNRSRELQMETYEPSGETDGVRRPALWSFHKTGTFSRRILRIPGVIVRPQGKLTVRVGTPPHIEQEFRDYSRALSQAA